MCVCVCVCVCEVIHFTVQVCVCLSLSLCVYVCVCIWLFCTLHDLSVRVRVCVCVCCPFVGFVVSSTQQDTNKRMSLSEYLIYRYKVDWHRTLKQTKNVLLRALFFFGSICDSSVCVCVCLQIS